MIMIIITTTIPPITPPAIPPALLPPLLPPLSLSLLSGRSGDADNDDDGVVVRGVVGDTIVVDVTSVTVDNDGEFFADDIVDEIVVIDDNDDDVPESCESIYVLLISHTNDS